MPKSRVTSPRSTACSKTRPSLHLWSPFTAAGRAALDATITLQAQIIAYIDDFKLLMILTLLAVPLVFFFKKPPGGDGEDHALVE